MNAEPEPWERLPGETRIYGPSPLRETGPSSSRGAEQVGLCRAAIHQVLEASGRRWRRRAAMRAPAA